MLFFFIRGVVFVYYKKVTVRNLGSIYVREREKFFIFLERVIVNFFCIIFLVVSFVLLIIYIYMCNYNVVRVEIYVFF